ncbi:MAG: VanZ family protein [Anaeroplasmataceae bacterium]|nr:VanZ family protein [Anaeroplasmataceae bacterium]
MKKNFKRGIFIIIAVIWMGVIFYFSHQNGTASSNMSGSVTRWVVNLFVPNFSDLTKSEQASILKDAGYVIRKLGHYSEYAVLGFFLFTAVYAFTSNEKIIFPIVSIFGILYAISDEFHQYFISGRAPAVKDVLIDSIGLLTMIFFIGFLLNLKKGRRKKVEE